MRIEVPFIPQTEEMNCGPAALRMVFSYFGKNYEMDELEEACDLKKGAACGTIQMAVGAAKLGFKAEIYSKSIDFIEENMSEEFYQQHGGRELMESYSNFLDEARRRGVGLEETLLDLEDLLKFVSKESVPVVLLDWNIIRGKEGYFGHFLPVVGYDKDYIYVHNPGPSYPKGFLPIERGIFEEARKAKGTDEDVLVIRKS